MTGHNIVSPASFAIIERMAVALEVAKARANVILPPPAEVIEPSAAEAAEFSCDANQINRGKVRKNTTASTPVSQPKGQQWFRLYAEIYRDPKLRRLPDALTVFWLRSLALFCEFGELPPDADAAFQLRISEAKFKANLKALQVQGLYDGRVPHNWDGRQYKSDTSTERVKRFRERSRNVSETPPDPDPESDPETDPETQGGVGGGASRRTDAFRTEFRSHLATALGEPRDAAESIQLRELIEKISTRAQRHNQTPTQAASILAEVYHRSHRHNGKIQDPIGYLIAAYETESKRRERDA